MIRRIFGAAMAGLFGSFLAVPLWFFALLLAVAIPFAISWQAAVGLYLILWIWYGAPARYMQRQYERHQLIRH